MKANGEDRIISLYEGEEAGPLLICLGAMHGNEPAGVKAIELVQKMLEVEHIRQPDFIYKGQFIGLIGNLQAYEKNVRFHKKDLNRMFKKDYIQELQTKLEPLEYEDRELLSLDAIVRAQIAKYKPSKVIVLDLHTTSSFGGIFTICNDDDEVAIQIGKALHAPIVLGMLESLSGTTLHYFTKENFGLEITPITFESGQHEELIAVNRAIAGILNTMKAIGSLPEDIVENHHEEILISYGKNLPALTSLLAVHSITENDQFKMNPGYKNFQKIKKGEILAQDRNGPIAASSDGLILMPLYQDKGEDGFFIVEKQEEKS